MNLEEFRRFFFEVVVATGCQAVDRRGDQRSASTVWRRWLLVATRCQAVVGPGNQLSTSTVWRRWLPVATRCQAVVSSGESTQHIHRLATVATAADTS